jgi:GTP cyclohydrolase II
MNWKELTDNLTSKNYIGCYGADHTAYHVLTDAKFNINISEAAFNYTEDEHINPDLQYLIDYNEKKQDNNWDNIVTFNPYGLKSNPPTIAAVNAKLELEGMINFEVDGVIVNENKTINCLKLAIEQVWHLPGIAKRMDIDEDILRQKFYNHLNDPNFLDKNKKLYIPPIGGISVFTFGDIKKLVDPNTEICLRIHDACLNSDCFRGTICTCAPYLMWGIEECVKTAQRGGVGFIFYFRKEGRALGEVIKFRVYNARKNRKEGDTSENYFNQTTSIAGVEDARHQRLMPDALLWLGIKKIDHLYSMSNDKYSALNNVGIYAKHRHDLPYCMIPPDAHIEISAKISSGYYSDVKKNFEYNQIDNSLKNISKVRESCQEVYNYVKNNKSKYFKINEDKLESGSEYIANYTKNKYPNLNINYHSRLSHIENWENEILKWDCDITEKIKRMIDLTFISVFLDAGAGNKWTYIKDGKKYNRSEGLAMAAFDMFNNGVFSSDSALPTRVNSHKLKNLSRDDLINGFQLTKKNYLIGLDGRLDLLKNFGKILDKNKKYFGKEIARPGNIIDHLGTNQIDFNELSNIIFNFSELTQDVHIHTDLKMYIPYHKLLQWLLYSLIDLFMKFRINVINTETLTALPEYRNGGMIIDLGIIEIKDKTLFNKKHDINSDLIIEWRCLTVILIDIIKEKVNIILNSNLHLGQLLESGTWKIGRELAKKNRNGLSPFTILSNGTVM